MSVQDDPESPVEGAEVSAPPAPERVRRRYNRPLVGAYAGLLLTLMAGAGAVTLFGSRLDGEPMVSLQLRAPRVSDAGTRIGTPFAGAVREIDGNPIADPALIEDSATGPLPRIGADGRMPRAVYARKADPDDKRPRIAIVLVGLGVSASRTDAAIAQLSPDVTLAFIPFAAELQSNVDKARGAGHEVLLELPMEPFDFPDSDPGPHALLVGATPEENAKRLDWSLSRATGYVGVANLLGGRFMGEENAMEPVLKRISARGLLFFDNGASSSSVALASARHVQGHIATGTSILDGVQAPGAIDSKLAELEMAARQDGFAIGVASAFPVSISRLAEWAARADSRGFHLVPLSALAADPLQSADKQPQKTATAQ